MKFVRKRATSRIISRDIVEMIRKNNFARIVVIQERVDFKECLPNVICRFLYIYICEISK